MKIKKILTVGLFAAATLSLAGCGNKEGESNNSNSNGNNQSSTINSDLDPNLSLLNNLKAKAKIIGANMLNKSESAVTFGEFEDEDAEADVYYYESNSLTFVDIEMYKEVCDKNLADNLKSYIPSTAKLSQNNDNDEYADYGMYLYNRIYTDGELSYDIYVEAYEEYDWEDGDIDPAETYGCVFIYKTSQQTAFDNYMSAGEE